MAITYEPAKTRDWSTRELDAIVGRQTCIDYTIGMRVGFCRGRVTEAGIGRFGQAYAVFGHGETVEWNRDTDKISITVEGER